MNEDLSDPNITSESLDQKTYIKTRQSYDEAELEVSGRYDKWILTLSGGALGLSITFVEKIAKNPTSDTLLWLKFSWGCLVISLLTALLSLVTSQSAIRENRNELDLAYSNDIVPSLSFPKWFTYTTNILNWSSLILFVLGVILLCIFSFKNIDQKITNGGITHGKETTAATSTEASEKKDRGRIRSTPATTATERKKGIRSTPATTEKRREMNNTKADAIFKKNYGTKSATDKVNPIMLLFPTPNEAKRLAEKMKRRCKVTGIEIILVNENGSLNRV